MATVGDIFKPGQEVPHSGIYRVIHDPNHSEEHEVTCVYGKVFPPCNHCGHHVRFVLVRAAHHIETHDHFK
jgi:hypothetical protein